jgi:uncharacterized protein (DUF58 family)
MRIIGLSILILIVYYISRKWGKLATRNFTFKRYVDKERIFAGERVRITTELVNRKVLPLPWIEIEGEIYKELDFLDQHVIKINDNSKKVYRIVTSLFPYERVKKHNIIYCNKRGFYSLYDIKITIGDFLGLNKAVINAECPIKLVVYPQIKPLEKLIMSYKEPQGNISVKRLIIPDPMEIVGAREYTTNDSFNTIDWNITAKTGNLYVKTFDYTASPSIMLLLNVQTQKVFWDGVNKDYIEKGIEIATAIANKAVKEKIAVGYSSNCFFSGESQDVFIAPRLTNKQEIFILEALAKTSYYRRMSMEDLLRKTVRVLDNSCTLVLITSYTSSMFIKELNYLSKKGYKIRLILLDDNVNTNGLNRSVDIYYCRNSSLIEGKGREKYV